jgi:hypothetical protein
MNEAEEQSRIGPGLQSAADAVVASPADRSAQTIWTRLGEPRWPGLRTSL